MERAYAAGAADPGFSDAGAIPDVTVVDRDQPVEQVLTRPPFAVFEVLSPDDTLPRTMQRLADFAAMGIGQIWVVDPETAKFYRYAGGGLAEATQFGEPGERVRFAVAEIQGFLD